MSEIKAADEKWMKIALEEASKAATLGEVPVGSLIVKGDELLGTAHNLRESQQSPIAHAEVLAIQQAASKLNSWRLLDCTLYVTLEPCTMCAGAIINARIPRLVYGTKDPKGGAVASLYQITEDSRLNHQVLVTEGVLADECAHLLKDFFRKLRSNE